MPMKRLSLAVVTAAAALVTLAQPRAAAAQSATTLKVLQWNVHHSGQGTDGVVDRGRQVAWIAGRAPDVVTMNEVAAVDVADYKTKLQQATGLAWSAFHLR